MALTRKLILAHDIRYLHNNLEYEYVVDYAVVGLFGVASYICR